MTMNVPVVDWLSTILTLAQNFLATMQPFIKILHGEPSYIHYGCHTLDTASVRIPRHLQSIREQTYRQSMCILATFHLPIVAKQLADIKMAAHHMVNSGFHFIHYSLCACITNSDVHITSYPPCAFARG